jgi:hypothetical protein
MIRHLQARQSSITGSEQIPWIQNTHNFGHKYIQKVNSGRIYIKNTVTIKLKVEVEQMLQPADI